MSNYVGDAMGMFNKVKKVVQQVALNLSETEIKVEEATSNEPWGPHGTVMTEIAEAAYDAEKYKDIMGVLARRLQDKGENWRHVYKSLLLLEHMLKHGPMKVVHELRSNVSIIEGLTYFTYKDPKGKDQGINVSNRAKLLVELIQDPDRIKQEREKARQNKNKYGGVSSSEMQGGGAFHGSSKEFTSYDDNYDSFDSKSTVRDSSQHGMYNADDSNTSGDGGQYSKASYKQPAVTATSEPYAGIDLSRNAPKLQDREADVVADSVPSKKKLSSTKVDPNIAQTFAKMTVSGSAAALPAPVTSQAPKSNWDAFVDQTSANVADKGTWDPFAVPDVSAAAAAPTDSWDVFSVTPGAGSSTIVGSNHNAIASISPGADFVSALTSGTPNVSVDPFALASGPSQPVNSFSAMASPSLVQANSSPAKPAPLPSDLFGPPQPIPHVMGGMVGLSQNHMNMNGFQQQQQVMTSGTQPYMGMRGMQPAHMGMGMPQVGAQPQMGFGMAAVPNPQMGFGMGGMQQPQMGGMQQPQMGGMQQPQMGGMLGQSHLSGMLPMMSPSGSTVQSPFLQRQPGMAGSVGQMPKNSSNHVMSSMAASKNDPFADLTGI